ncbi:hypothetical protein DV517_62230 [Streptomyces sp. S816]|uniref:hypothetical protein n=1 Tax=Streptomyces sp. S816 TaxID=2283197 RepID=UPI00109D23CB|nr:hypothetical protein [Streptomyces sp. S816]TGZ14740.1 hypothetical protein DV517_62230 [Streptomyces sp. S816]
MTSRNEHRRMWTPLLRKLAPILLDTAGIILLSGFTMAWTMTSWSVSVGGWILGLGVLALNRVHFGDS